MDFFNEALWDLVDCSYWLSDMFHDFLDVIYESEEWGWMFYLALFPTLFLFVFDLMMTFILSVRLRELKLFNAFSPKSWRMLNDSRNRSINNYSMSDLKNHPRDTFLKYTRLSSLAVRLNQYKHVKAGDIIRSKDGFKSVYQGVKLNKDGSVLYKYHTNNGILFSTMKPSQWAKSTGSQRMNSVKFTLKKNK